MPPIPRMALVLPTGVFLLHVFLSRVVGLYGPYPWLDVPMHVLGGVAIAAASRSVLRAWCAAGILRPLERWLEALLLVSITALAAMVWEFAEFTTDRLGWTRAQAGLEDTLLDMGLGLAGAVLVAAACLGRPRASDRP